jgi:hypothetical protein
MTSAYTTTSQRTRNQYCRCSTLGLCEVLLCLRYQAFSLDGTEQRLPASIT